MNVHFIPFLTAVLLGSSDIPGIWQIRSSRVRVCARPRASHEAVAFLKRGARVKVVASSVRGRWLKVSGWIGVADSKNVLVIIPFCSHSCQEKAEVLDAKASRPKRRACPDSTSCEPMPYAWVPKRAARPDPKPPPPHKVYTFDDLEAMRISVSAAIRGFREDQRTFLSRRQSLDRMLTSVRWPPKLAAAVKGWVLKSKLGPGRYDAFRLARKPEETGSDVWIEGEDTLPDLGADVLDAMCEIVAGDVAMDMVADMVADIMAGKTGQNCRYPVTDPGLNVYVNMVAALVGEFSSRYDILYRVAIVEDRAVNTHSWPGGYIVVTTALLELCQNEAQLAAALAHEIAHLSRDHGLMQHWHEDQELRAPGRTEAFVKLERLITRFFTTGSLPPDSLAHRELAGFAARCRAATYGKERRVAEEREADKYALAYLVRSGYAPTALREIVESLRRSAPLSPGKSVTCYAPPEERLKHIRECIADSSRGLTLPKTSIDRDREADYNSLVRERLREWRKTRPRGS